MPDENQKTDEQKKNDRKKTIAVVAAAVFLLLILFLAYRATRSEPAAPFENAGMRVSNIKATLDPPYTHYEVFTSDVTGNVLNFTWKLDTSDSLCTHFTWSGSKATWQHNGGPQPNGQPDEDPGYVCSHNGPVHPGTITVTVTDGTHTVTRTDTHGSGDYDPNPLYPSG